MKTEILSKQSHEVLIKVRLVPENISDSKLLDQAA